MTESFIAKDRRAPQAVLLETTIEISKKIFMSDELSLERKKFYFTLIQKAFKL